MQDSDHTEEEEDDDEVSAALTSTPDTDISSEVGRSQ
jgi:hypothetical protein